MVESDPEVENVLREIRERVRSENKTAIVPALHHDEASTPDASGSDGTPHETHIAPDNGLREANNALLRMKMNLATTERAWSRLPPLFSYRSGSLSRVELWLKRQLKRATHWFTWEQINFNAAVHQSLSELHTALIAHGQTLLTLQQQTDALHATTVQLIALQNEAQSLRASVETRFIEIENSLAADLAQLRQTLVSNIEHLREDARQTAAANAAQTIALDSVNVNSATLIADARGEWQKQFVNLQSQSNTQIEEWRAQAEGLQNELRERIQNILDEQRACYKQLALHTSESAVIADRARRNFEQRLAELENRSKFQVPSSK